jgi:NTE family protein
MQYNFKNLVFEGGGVKGIAYGGALEVLNDMAILKNVERIAGTSAGAINAVLLSIGYTHQEVSKIIAETNFKDFEDDSFFIVRDIRRLLNYFGWYKGDKFKIWLKKYILLKTGNSELTFAEMQNLKSTKNFKDLYVVATNLSQQKVQVFSHETTPDVKIADAVRTSMSIPLYFQSIKYKNDIYVDGGVSWNYPINLFDYKKYLSNPLNGEQVEYSNNSDYVFNYETLGFRLDSTAVIEYAKHNWASEPVKVSNVKSYSSALINFLMETANKAHLKSNDWNRTIFIDTLDVKTTQFELSREKIEALIKSGKENTLKYFDWRNKDEKHSKLPA